MKIIKLGEQLNSRIVLCLGFFGSMHVGHVELLGRAKLRAEMVGGKVALFTFSNNHLKILKRDSSVVYTYDERLSIYESLGVDYVITAEFNNDFKRLTGKQFLSMLDFYDLESVVCGFDHHCGSNRMDALSIRKYFKNIPVYIVEPICVNGEKVSTTSVRKYITENNIEKANSLLSERFFITGNVTHGRGVGKTLGFPTANIDVPCEKLLPSGVFSAKIRIGGSVYSAIVNIGNTPTFDIDRKAVEVHIIGFSGDLYGLNVKVSLVRHLRPIRKFNSSDELSLQLQLDKEDALND